MANVKEVKISGWMPFNIYEHPASLRHLGWMNSPSVGVHIRYDSSRNVPSKYGGSLTEYHFSIEGREAMSFEHLENWVRDFAEAGAEFENARARDIEERGNWVDLMGVPTTGALKEKAEGEPAPPVGFKMVGGIAVPKLRVQVGGVTVDTTDEEPEGESLFGPPISTYSRAQAIADGELVDVSQIAREAGWKHPVAITRAVYEAYVKVPPGLTGQDEQGRLWDIVYLAALEAKKPHPGGPTDTIRFGVHVRNENRERTPPLRMLKAVIGPGDTPEPVVTIMELDQD